MKIKSFILAVAFAGSTFIAFAQKGEVNSAKNNYDKFVTLKDANSILLGMTNLNQAKTSIDKAVMHEKTMNEPTAWTYKALIYADMALLDTIPSTSRPLFNEALAASKKAEELDKEGANKPNLDRVKDLMAQYELNMGVKSYQANKFEDAYKAFSNSLNYRPGDTTITYYAGLSAINAQNYKGAIRQYEALTKTNYSANPQIYLDLSKMYSMQGDTTKALAIAAEGARKYNDAQLVTQEIELSLMSGKQMEVIGKISDQLQKDPTNKLYAFYLGIAYNSAGDNKKAEEAYRKALEIDPNFADANTNLGGLLLNQGIDLYNTANKLPQNKQKEYDEMMKTATAKFDKAFPYLQKSSELNPKSKLAWDNLKTYYIIKKNQAKVDEITKKLKDLQ